MALQIFSLCFISTEKMTEIRQWLDDTSKHEDLIVSASFIAGFEWPSVLIMTSKNYDAQFFVRNMVMRAMSRLVWLKTDIFDSIYERSALAIGNVRDNVIDFSRETRKGLNANVDSDVDGEAIEKTIYNTLKDYYQKT